MRSVRIGIGGLPMKNMLFKLIVVGRVKDVHYQAKINEFIQRLNAFGKIEIQELRDDTVEKESAAILKALENERGWVVILDERGENITSVELANKFSSCDRKIVLVIGGAFGFTDEVRKRADYLLALSKFTVTHEMARLLLAEQLYRACTIIAGKKYHH
ncbi:MAG: 23S rRNA (pseudouridine(1915)-N(3))-methyltransferase RlmH [Lentisphaerae bacterium]|nr:23S rRNA (pseudouridine(1915)-N(3))-methyltransferase RlmH [Lentisphaerota bacterium]